MWCEPDDHPFFQSIHSTKYPLFYSSFSSNHPGADDYIVRHGVPQPAATTFAFPSLGFLFYASSYVAPRGWRGWRAPSAAGRGSSPACRLLTWSPPAETRGTVSRDYINKMGQDHLECRLTNVKNAVTWNVWTLCFLYHLTPPVSTVVYMYNESPKQGSKRFKVMKTIHCAHLGILFIFSYSMPFHGCSNRDRLGFYAEIQIIVGTVTIRLRQGCARSRAYSWFPCRQEEDEPNKNVSCSPQCL